MKEETENTIMNFIAIIVIAMLMFATGYGIGLSRNVKQAITVNNKTWVQHLDSNNIIWRSENLKNGEKNGK